MVMLALLLAVHAVGVAVTVVRLLTIDSLWMLFVWFIMFADEENVFSNLTIGFVIVVSSCDVVKIGCDIMGDEDEEQMFINVLDGNDGEDDIMRDALEVVNAKKFWCAPETEFGDTDDVSRS